MSTSEHERAIIRTMHLSRTFKQIAALREIDLDIQRGEIFGLIGPDGAGKTTLLRLLAAVMTPTAGRVTVAGFDSMKDAEKIRLHIGYMPQKFSLYGDLSVRENLAFYADIFGVHGAERERRFEQVLSFAHMTTITERRARQLSGGMQKKLGLACTLIHRPEVLLLDEPTTGVDPVSRREFWDLLTELHLQGTTLVVSTPYMDEAERCNRIGLLLKGQLIECRTPREIKALVSGQVVEKDLALALARQLRDELVKRGRVRVAMTRDDDRYLTLEDRAAVARRLGAAMFLSLHIDSAPNPLARGASVYSLSDVASDAEAAQLAAQENGTSNIAEGNGSVESMLSDLVMRSQMSASADLAMRLVRKSAGQFELRPDPHRFAAFAVLRNAGTPAVLFEAGYISNADDEVLLRTPAHRSAIVLALAQAIEADIASRSRH